MFNTLRPYKTFLLYLVYVLCGIRRKQCIALLLFSHFFIYYVVGYMNYVSLVALMMAVYLIVIWFMNTLAIDFPWETLISTEEEERLMNFETIVSVAVALQGCFYEIKVGYDQARRENFHKFTFNITVVLLSVAYVTHFIPGFWLFYFMTMSLLITPSFYYYKIPKKVSAIVFPLYEQAYMTLMENSPLEIDDAYE
eukprot:TRINITY_DN10717_c0_g1_i1.p1 TRINITY_DN10717_c0_g1~~TRINITY_DN10717_c0_g1_i1.p1  ORF type:complete len:213 (-),score=23.56 TRINITY_DN10717_c0_g1_i1:19-606(-)